MQEERDLIVFSYLQQEGSSDSKVAQKIMTQLKAFQSRKSSSSGARMKTWDRSMIQPGQEINSELDAALRRCRIAVILVSSEYLASDHWQDEAGPLLAAMKEKKIILLWQELSACNWRETDLGASKPMIAGCILDTLKSPMRRKKERLISEMISTAWDGSLTFSAQLAESGSEIAALPAPLSLPAASPPNGCTFLALVITTAGPKDGSEPGQAGMSFEWQVWCLYPGASEYQQISNSAICAADFFTVIRQRGKREPTFKGSCLAVMSGLRSWAARNTTDHVWEIFAPLELLEEDWHSMEIQVSGLGPRRLGQHQLYLLRSSDRLDPHFNDRRPCLRRMHQHLQSGTGSWLEGEEAKNTEVLERLDGLQPLAGCPPSLAHQSSQNSYGPDVFAAIRCGQIQGARNKREWLKSLIYSFAPLAAWPSRPERATGEAFSTCLQRLPLNVTDTGCHLAVHRPHCPDLAQLARARLRWNDPDLDISHLTILVDHPERHPKIPPSPASAEAPPADSSPLQQSPTARPGQFRPL